MMCGIAGAVDLGGTRVFDQPRLLAMTRTLAHRGPDEEDAHTEPGVAMGARRLSIVDIEGGRQPIANETGDVWVAFNGELFDYPELRQELLSRGHRLETRCDTEAWVHLYEDLGDSVFERARGQFAVALWDRSRRKLILGRDRMGICPLYYAQRDGWLLWGSEVKALLASGLVDARPDPKGIDHLFSFFCAGTTRTCFVGVKSIPPGHTLIVQDGRIELHRYWDLDFPDAGDERNDDPTRLTEELEALIRKAVRRRLRADVPVVSYISGGLDSSVVLGLSMQEYGRALPSFTIGLADAGPDERVKAAESASLLGSPLSTLSMNCSDIAAAYPDLILAAEGPVIDTACACLLRLAGMVHQEGYKVALTGEGADEALAGYPWFKTQKSREIVARVIGRPILRLVRRALVASIGGGSDHLPPRKGMAGVRTAQQDLYEWIAQGRETLYAGEMWERLGNHSPYLDLDLSNDRITRWHQLNQSLYAGYKIMLPGLLLKAKGDHVAMRSSVETRYPFLDEEVVDFCAHLHPKYKLRRLTDKWLLRQVARKCLPDPIARRAKTTFRASLTPVFMGPERPTWVGELLSPESLQATGYFDPKGVARVSSAVQRPLTFGPRRLSFDAGLVGVVATQLWHHIYCGGGLADLPTWSPGSLPAPRGGRPTSGRSPPPSAA